MATSVIDISPGGDKAFSLATTIDGVSIRLAFRWLPRLSRWWLDVQRPDGSPLALHGLVQPGGRVLLDPRAGIRGALRFVGPEDYTESDIGDTLRLVYDDAVESTPYFDRSYIAVGGL
jgi:hypothetical protein